MAVTRRIIHTETHSRELTVTVGALVILYNLVCKLEKLYVGLPGIASKLGLQLSLRPKIITTLLYS